MARPEFVRFQSTDGPVAFHDTAQVVELLPEVFPHWPFYHEKQTTERPCLEVSRKEGKFLIASPTMDRPKVASNTLNAACTLLAELAWARIRHEPDLLCFHGAAIEFDGALALFPNKRRAGKSTLTACLSAKGHRVFTDDYLPLRSDHEGRMAGVANGAQPRLRLPIPEDFSSRLKQWLAQHKGPSNRQYQYLNLDTAQLARHGESLPVASIVLLDRTEQATSPRLEPVETPEVLRRLIFQNFSRSMNPARILAMICELAESANCLCLTYSNAEEAAEYLTCKGTALGKEKKLQKKHRSLPEAKEAVFAVKKTRLQDTAYVQNPSVFLRRYGDDVFLATPDGPGMHHFDGVTNGIWGLLSEPVTQEDVCQVLSAAFPDEPRDQIAQAVRKTMQSMANYRLISPLDDGSSDKGSQAMT
ncbi:PqqD family peptide modification chaperone [Shimia biformata]|uniref:PqqD family peptide modification chaperone n=1 Tax=Shimia biformata TaxID=1294299 RepID=UPI00194F30C6|nr:PqqD family peptide modification chaperone [Shimia biformata]